MTRQRQATRQGGHPPAAATSPDGYAGALRHHRDGRLEEAAATYRRVLGVQPRFAEAHYNLGVVCARLERGGEAIACFRRAIALQPDLVEAQFDLGCMLAGQGEFDEAIACFRQAIAIRPDYLAAHNNLGNALRASGRLEEALLCYRAAIACKADLPQLHCNLANTLMALARTDEAAIAYRRVISLKPDHVEAHTILATVLLARGDLAAGWQEYEWRWKQPLMMATQRSYPQPQWRGDAALHGKEKKTLLIHPEGGFGDTLQFCRYAPLAAARGLRVILEVQAPLVRLIQGLPGVDQVIAQGEAPPHFDLHCPMLSLPLALGTTLDNVPAAVPYLQADPARVAAIANRLAALEAGKDMRRVGLVWAGNPRLQLAAAAAVDRRRSVAPAILAPLLEVPGLHFVSLQKGGPAAPAGFAMTDLMDEMADFADTAALIAALDLIIAVDTSVVHLAGALGKPVWMLDRFDHCWRWLDGRSDSPWYPTMRLYRQTLPGAWEGVVADIAHDLHIFTGASAACGIASIGQHGGAVAPVTTTCHGVDR